MPVDERLLAEAQRAAAQITEAQREVDTARGAFQRSVRALYLEGGSMREIADGLNLSHQRVHQLLDLPAPPAGASGSAGGRAGKRRGRRGAAPCSFCARTQDQVLKLICGAGSVAICNDCVALGVSAVRHSATATDSRVTLATQPRPGQCPFCGKHTGPSVPGSGTDEELSLIVAPGTVAAICGECLDLCVDIIDGEPAAD